MKDAKRNHNCSMSQILVLLKPDAIQGGHCRTIIERLRASGFEIAEIRSGTPDRELVLQHYAHLATYGPGVLQRNADFLCDGTVVMLVVKGEIAALRKLTGATDPSKAAPGTIRREYSTDSIAQAEAEQRGLRNVMHASDSDETAAREIQLWRQHFVARPASSREREASLDTSATIWTGSGADHSPSCANKAQNEDETI